MNKTLKSIVMMFFICALGYINGCKADNIKNENPQAIKIIVTKFRVKTRVIKIVIEVKMITVI